MTDITVIILTGNERLHIARCIEKLAALEPRQIVIVDSESTDGTRQIAEETAAKLGLDLRVVVYPWPGNQAAQFQRALDDLLRTNVSDTIVRSKWILRLDADEYLTEELIEEIKAKLPRMEEDVDGVVLKRRHVVGWLGDKWVKRGMYPTRILRLFRAGHGRSDMKIMDEHIVVDRKVVEFDHDFIDHSLISFEDWKVKHRAYAKREAQSHLAGEKSTGEKAGKKELYYKLPRYLRPFVYFALRFLVKGAIFEGFAAWRWCFYHALRYRWMVDYEIGKLKKI